MNARLKSALLWGVVGALTFLVLVQGFTLWTGQGIDPLVTFSVAVLVAVGAATVAYVSEVRFAPGGTAEPADENETS